MIDAAAIGAGTRLQADVCIVGSGPAALATASKLLDTRASLIILEAGYPRYDSKVQSDYRGRRDGDSAHPLHRSRDRRLGGTGVRWAGRTRPFDREDFERREWMPGSGWPLSLDDLAGYYRDAAEFCRVSSITDEEWRARLPASARLEHPDLVVRRLGCKAPLDFGATHGRSISRHPAVRLLTGATVVGLRAAAGGGRIEHVEVARPDGARFTVTAGLFVIACGGIENARLLLSSNDVVACGIGNQNDLVGRYFMDHPSINAGLFVARDGAFPVQLFRFDGPGDPKEAHGQIALSPALMAREGLCSAAASFNDAPPLYARVPAYGSGGVRAAREVLDDLRHGEWPAEAGRQARAMIAGAPPLAGTILRRLRARRSRQAGVRVALEQQPERHNRVTLSRARDRFGMPRVEVSWRVGGTEQRSFRRLCQLLDAHFGACGLGSFEFFEPVGRPDSPKARRGAGRGGVWPATSSSACHHMGTTRMSSDPSRGVVDASGRVHGVGNLYVAGSSVFPTGSSANPTLTIVALSLRLGDELARRLR